MFCIIHQSNFVLISNCYVKYIMYFISDHEPVTFILKNARINKAIDRWQFSTPQLTDKNFNEYFKRQWASFKKTNDRPDINAATKN